MKLFIDSAIAQGPFWDVCCDHGYVGIGALESNLFTEVHFVDQVPHIMARLQHLIEQSAAHQVQRNYFFHCLPGECIGQMVEGTLLIAGVGGLTTKNILETLLSKEKLKAGRLLLSPHTDEKVLCDFLSSPGFTAVYDMKQKMMIEEGPRQRPLYLLDLK